LKALSRAVDAITETLIFQARNAISQTADAAEFAIVQSVLASISKIA
jgi:hypothetical protein